MAPIPLTRDASDRPNGRYKGCLETILSALERQSCLVFLGSGASKNPEGPSLPTGPELAELIARACELDPPGSVPLSTAAFYYEFYRTREDLNSLLVEQLDRPEIDPPATLVSLAELILQLEQQGLRVFVITTNYDRMFEKAYQQASNGREPGVIIYKGAWDPKDKSERLHDGLEGEPEYWIHDDRGKPATMLYKMHGCISKATGQNLVITEEDYVNFMTNAISNNDEKRILNYVRGRIAQSTILFVGYSLSDFNFRVLFKATAEGRGRRSYALQCFDEESASPLERARWDATAQFWGRKDVEILNMDAAQFTKDLEALARLSVATK